MSGAALGLMLAFGSPASACPGVNGCPFSAESGKHTCDGNCAHHKASHTNPAKHLEKMKTRLGLNATQVATIKGVFDEAGTKRNALKEQPRTPEKFKAMRQLRWDTEDKVHATLTCEQRDELRKMKREHRSERKKRHHKYLRKHKK